MSPTFWQTFVWLSEISATTPQNVHRRNFARTKRKFKRRKFVCVSFLQYWKRKNLNKPQTFMLQNLKLPATYLESNFNTLPCFQVRPFSNSLSAKIRACSVLGFWLICFSSFLSPYHPQLLENRSSRAIRLSVPTGLRFSNRILAPSCYHIRGLISDDLVHFSNQIFWCNLLNAVFNFVSNIAESKHEPRCVESLSSDEIEDLINGNLQWRNNRCPKVSGKSCK